MSSCSYCDHVPGGVCPAHQRKWANVVAAEIKPPVEPEPTPEPESDTVLRRRK